MKTKLKKVISTCLAAVMLLSTMLGSSISVSAAVDDDGRYVPSDGVETNRYYFLMPDDWFNEYTSDAGIYWWDATDAPDSWENMHKAQKGDCGNVFYVDCPKDVTSIIWTNMLVASDFDDTVDSLTLPKQTVNIPCEYYDPGESDLYPDGLPEGFDNMIYVCTNIGSCDELVGPGIIQEIYEGDWFYYYGDGKYGTTAEPTNEPVTGNNTIYFQVPDDWNNYKYIFCHVWATDGSGSWPAWQSKAEKCTDEGNGLYSYDLSKTKNEIDPAKGVGYAVIFSANTGSQTYNALMSAECIGDTLCCTGNHLEAPEDSGKTPIEVTWKNHTDKKFGPEKKITSSGNIVGTALPEGSTDATLLATYIVQYLGDTNKTDRVSSLMEELGVSADEAYEAAAKRLDDNGDEMAEEKKAEIKKLLGITDATDEGGQDVTSSEFEYTILDDGTAEITGYTGSATELTIPSELDGKSVTSIGNWAFSDCTSLASITIPDSVTEIGHYAFSDCTSLASITIPDSVTEIGYWAFSGCTSLTSITIPDSVTEIGYGAFENTAWYDNQPDGVVYAGKVLYTYKGEMPQNTTITVKDGTKSISDGAFEYCTSLTSITIPDSVTSISDYAFSGCTSLASITIPDSVTEIGSGAFSDCTSLTSITIPDSVTSIGYVAFENCTGLSSVTISGGVTEIGLGVFENCTSLISVTIPDSVTSIGDWAFENCTSLKSVDIPSSVTEIAYKAFFSCSSLVEVEIPSTVKKISDNALGYDSETEKVNDFAVKGYNGTAAEDYANENGFKFISLGEVPTKDPEVLGDVNADGKININDVTTIQKSAASLVTLTENQKKAADVNGDGKVNIKDVTAIQRYTAGIDTGFEIGK